MSSRTTGSPTIAASTSQSGATRLGSSEGAGVAHPEIARMAERNARRATGFTLQTLAEVDTKGRRSRRPCGEHARLSTGEETSGFAVASRGDRAEPHTRAVDPWCRAVAG